MKDAGRRIGLPVVLGVIMLWTLVPIIWMVASSFKPSEDLTATPPKVGFSPTLDHYRTCSAAATTSRRTS